MNETPRRPRNARKGARFPSAGIRCALLLLAALLLLSACASSPDKPRELEALREWLLRKAKQKFQHALRITERHAPDPFNQARQHLLFTLIALKEYREAEEVGRKFIEQKTAYLEAARTRLAELELDWKKALAGDETFKGSRREKNMVSLQKEWKSRIQRAENQIVSLSLLLGDVLLRRDEKAEAISVFKQALAVAPDHNTALRRIGQAYALLGDHAVAANYMTKAFLGLQQRLETVRSETPSAGEEASAKQASRVPALERGAVEIAGVTALLHVLAGDADTARTWFNHAGSFDPTSPYVDLKIAVKFIRDGKLRPAAEHISAFLDTLPEGDGLVRTLVNRLLKQVFVRDEEG